jgi:hypothetical protein
VEGYLQSLVMQANDSLRKTAESSGPNGTRPDQAKERLKSLESV